MEDKYNEIPIIKGKLAEIVKNFIMEVHIEAGINNIKIGLPIKAASRLKEELFDSYSWIKSDYKSTEEHDSNFTGSITYPGNLKLILEVLE